MVFDIYNPYENQSVTVDYVDVIEKSLLKAGFKTNHITEIKKDVGNKERGLVAIAPLAVLNAKRAGYKKIIYWIQGASENESFMRHHSFFRYYVLLLIHRQAQKNADYNLYCSDYMKDHYTKKFHLRYSSKKRCFVMPCFNDEIHRDSFFVEGKYDNNVFVYVGGLSAWQCFEETVEIYSQIEKRIKSSTFRVLTKDREKAEEIIKKYGVERYSLDFVSKNEVENEMKQAKFGFCVRADSIVNRVASPTKLSNYVSNGVMPIYSDSIKGFHSIAKECSYCFSTSPQPSLETVERIVAACTETIEAAAVYTEFDEKFGCYYSKKYYIEQLSKEFREVFA